MARARTPKATTGEAYTHDVLGYVPSNPTDGWMRSALEKLGVTARGVNMSEDECRRRLIAMSILSVATVERNDDDKRDKDR
jgi:hypothetical protein